MTNALEDPIRAAIDDAEEIRDPLEDLLARTEADPGAPFAPGRRSTRAAKSSSASVPARIF